MSPEEQARYLQQELERARAADIVDERIFLLKESERTIILRASGIEEALADVDGTLNTVGADELDEPNVRELALLANVGVDRTAVTGRHTGQIDRLYQTHSGDFGIDQVIAEQGAYRMRGPGQVEYFLGNEDIERNVAYIRENMIGTLQAAAQRFNVTFIPTSEGGHRSMYSVDAMKTTRGKIDDRQLHENIMQMLQEAWMQISNSAQWNLGTSSTGTFEWSNSQINKDVAVNKHLTSKGAVRSSRVFLGDSSNDKPVFVSNGLLKGVVFNGPASKELVPHGDIAVIGTGNAAPILRLIRDARINAHRL